MRRNRHDYRQDELSTAFPLIVIGGAIVLIVAYLAVTASLTGSPRQQARVFVPAASETVVATR